MDLMTLAAKITLDDSSFNKGISNAEKAGQALQGRMSAMTVAVGNIVSDMVRKGFNGIQQIVGGAMEGYADYQQLIGGVETLFKSSSGKVAKYAKESFKTTGLSANDYMETVTSFSASLLQGLNGNTEKAADMANMAITDMADNANKMGTDISSIQAAYQGFAKQNYTMLDNLKLGYGGTQSEMVRLVNDSKILDHEIKNLDGITFDQLVQAIHVIQTEMGVTGTTAKEAADTISGSKASLAASWEDLLTAVGGEGDQARLDEAMENFKTSFSTYMENFLPTLVGTIKNSGQLTQAIADAVTDLPATLLSEIGKAGLESGTNIISAASDLTSWLITSLTNVFRDVSADPSQVKEFGTAIGDFVGTAISQLITNAPDILAGIVDAGMALAGGLVEGLFNGLFGEDSEVEKITSQLEKELTGINVNSEEATAILQYMSDLNAKYGEGVEKTAAWKEAQKQLENVLPDAGKVFEKYGSDVGGALAELEKLNEQMRRNAILTGMENALRAERELYGEQTAEAELARTRAGIAEGKLTTAQTGIEESLKAYAARALEMYGENPMVRDEARAEWERLSRGRISINGQEFGFSEVDFDELRSAIDGLSGMVDEAEASIWNTSGVDNIYSPEEIEGFLSAIQGYTNEINEQNRIAEEADRQAEATAKEIDVTVAALMSTYEDAYGGASDAVAAGGESVRNALDWVAGMIQGMGFSAPWAQKATGIEEVPYNGFRAELHKGEAVLTPKQAKDYREGGGVSSTDLEDRIIAAIREGMADAQVTAVVTDRQVARGANRYNGNEIDSGRFRP